MKKQLIILGAIIGVLMMSAFVVAIQDTDTERTPAWMIWVTENFVPYSGATKDVDFNERR